MTSANRFDADLPRLLDELAAGSHPDYLSDVLERTVTSRQRRTLATIERTLHVDLVTPRPVTRPSLGINLRLIAVLVALALTIAGLIVLSPGRRALPPPFGAAANGSIAYSQGGDILALDPVTRATRTLIGGPEDDGSPSWSLQGDRFSFFRVAPEGRILYVANDRGGDITRLGGPYPGLDTLEWSPDGSRIAVAWNDGGRGVINLVATDGSGARQLDIGVDATLVSWRPPDGRLLVFRGQGAAGPDLFVVRPDGTGVQALGVADERVATDDRALSGVTWSPDGTRISYNGVGWRSPDVPEMRTVVLVVSETGQVQSQTRLVFDPANQDEAFAVWSPDSRRLTLNVAGVDEQVMHVAVGNSDGTGELTIIGPPTTTRQAMERRWSPDGQQLLARYWEEQQAWLFDPDGGPGEQVSYWATSSDAPSWQRMAP